MKRRMLGVDDLDIIELVVEAAQVGRRIEGCLMALHLPDHFPQTIHDGMLGGHRVAMLFEQTLVALTDTGRLIDRQLFGNRKVHG